MTLMNTHNNNKKTLKHGIVCLNFTLVTEENVTADGCINAVGSPHSWGHKMFALQVQGLEFDSPRAMLTSLIYTYTHVHTGIHANPYL